MKGKRLHVVLMAMILLVVFASVIVLSACEDGNSNKTYFDNENDPLVFSTQEVDKVFNPFFSTSATDSNVVGMTQISMLSNDKEGVVAYGDNEAVVVKDLEKVTEGEGEEQITTYKFVLKNNIKFSNNSPLTIKDVLFNLYVYLDPAYTGSSTIYSTDIVGLKEYRTQQADDDEQDNFKNQFKVTASAQIDALISACSEILDKDSTISEENFMAELQAYVSINDVYKDVVVNYNKAIELFKNELNDDFSNSLDSYEDTIFKDKEGNIYKNLFTTDVEMFLYNEGYITWNKKDAKIESSLTTPGQEASLKSWTKEQAIDTILKDMIPGQMDQVIAYWRTGTDLSEYLENKAMEEYFEGAERAYPNISGIKFANRTEAVTVNGVTYDVPTYAEDGSVSQGNEVLSIQIHKVDPKAIWNFAFTVAPMYYYSDAAHISAFDFESNFGVEYGSQSFMTDVVKSADKIGVPVGAGPYAASKSSGGISDIKAGEFYDKGVIYFERNPYYLMGAAKIKKVRFQVVSSMAILNSLYSGAIDYAEPNAKPETIAELNGKRDQGIGNKSIRTSGYGYIGINAGKVPSLAVRKVIMYCINTQECVDYYKTTAQPIYRSMSLSNWAYPEGSTSYYPYIAGKIPANLNVVDPEYKSYVTKLGKKAGEYLTEAEQKEFLVGMIEEAGYTLNANDIYQKGNSKLEYTFTIAGEETDHPAYNAMVHAGELLNKIGFNITVTTDAQALKKLSTGALTVWAAAWGSTIDPDMYQVYHKDSNATSVLNWGYKQILRDEDTYSVENEIINELSELIEKARETDDQKERKNLYAEALNLVMQLAVELPTYQRDDLFAFNTNKIDVSTLTPDSETSPYKGLTSDMHLISLNEER